MTKKVLSTGDGTLDWEDAADGDFFYIGDELFEVNHVGKVYISVRDSRGETREYAVKDFTFLGLTLQREVEDHPNGIIPTRDGAIIQIGDVVYQAVYEKSGGRTWTSGVLYHDIVTSEGLQATADKHGFTEYVPKTSEPESATIHTWYEAEKEN